MLQKEMVLLLFPVVCPVERKIVPAPVPSAVWDDPSTVHRVTTFPLASLINRIVPVPPVVETVVLEIVSEFPAVFRPSNVTLSAPLKLINAPPAVVAPVTVRTPTGVIVSLFQELTEG